MPGERGIVRCGPSRSGHAVSSVVVVVSVVDRLMGLGIIHFVRHRCALDTSVPVCVVTCNVENGMFKICTQKNIHWIGPSNKPLFKVTLPLLAMNSQGLIFNV